MYTHIHTYICTHTYTHTHTHTHTHTSFLSRMCPVSSKVCLYVLICKQKNVRKRHFPQNRHFPKEGMQMSHTYMKRYSISITNFQENASQNHNEILPHMLGWLVSKKKDNK